LLRAAGRIFPENRRHIDLVSVGCARRSKTQCPQRFPAGTPALALEKIAASSSRKRNRRPHEKRFGKTIYGTPQLSMELIGPTVKNTDYSCLSKRIRWEEVISYLCGIMAQAPVPFAS
jgi:hypothetical protein